MHDLRNFNNGSFESTMIILYDNSTTTVIHTTTWSQGSQHSLSLLEGSVFSGTHGNISLVEFIDACIMHAFTIITFLAGYL